MLDRSRRQEAALGKTDAIRADPPISSSFPGHRFEADTRGKSMAVDLIVMMAAPGAA